LERYRDKFNRPDIETFPYSPRIQKHFEEADVFVLPSHEEGSPLVTYIAMAAGLPCLTSFAGGGGLINNGCEGLVVDPWNDAAFQQAIYSLATDSGLREKLGRAAEKAAAKYVWPEVARRRAEGFRTAASLAQRS
jgi:glycosyltransferase involved in cell wall biosynthesis